MRARLIPLIVCVVLLGGLAAVALGQVGSPSPARAAAVQAAGAFEISNSGEGQPIFAAAGLAPGGSAYGNVTIEDDGSVPIGLKLRRGKLTDTPGVGGGVLSGRLQLVVADVTEPSRPRTIYAGPLASMPAQDAGELEPGESRTYEFTATLPDGSPSSQNALQGAATAVAYSWSAAAITGGKGAPLVETPTGGPDGGEDHSAPPAGGGEAAGVGALGLTVSRILARLSSGVLVAYVDCDSPCRIEVRGKLRAVAHGHHRAARIRLSRKRIYASGKKRMRIPVPRDMRNWLRRMPPPQRLRGKLSLTAIGTAGGRDVVTKAVRLRVHQR